MSHPPARPARPAPRRLALAPALALGLGLALAALPAAEARRGPADPLEGFDAQVRQELAAWNVPGAAVAIVGPAGPVLLEGFGVANRDTGAPVTPDTRFAIGSITKGFTATLLATFVDEGLLAWDRPVAEVLPDFRMADPVATETLTLRDLLTHRSGLPRHDMTWYRSGQTRDALYAGLRYLPPTAGLRDRAQYQNLMVMVAGRMAEQAGGRRWEDLLKERLLVPLGMGATGFWTQATGSSPQFASGYAERDGELVRTPFLDLTGIAPAASLASTARDLAAWLAFQLDRGRAGEIRLVSPGQWNELHRAQVVAEPLPFPEFTNDAYGLGWRVTSYRGRPAYGHDGMVDGYSAVVMVVPGNGFGIAVLANRDNSMLPLALALEAADRLLGAPPSAWSARLRRWQDQQRAARTALDEAQAIDRKAGTVPSHPMADYAGEYTHPAYGALHVIFKDGGLAVNFGGIPAVRHEPAGGRRDGRGGAGGVGLPDRLPPPALAGDVRSGLPGALRRELRSGRHDPAGGAARQGAAGRDCRRTRDRAGPLPRDRVPGGRRLGGARGLLARAGAGDRDAADHGARGGQRQAVRAGRWAAVIERATGASSHR